MTGIVQKAASAMVFALALTAGFSENLEGQAQLLGPGGAYLGAGLSSISISDLDDRLSAAGYPTFGNSAVALTLGGYRILRSGLMLGAEANGLIMGEEKNAQRQVGLGGGYGTLGVGYMVNLSPQARIYPRLGLGIGGMGMWFEDEGVEVDFDDALADPQPTRGVDPVLSRGGGVIDLGGGAEFVARGGGGALVGVRLGYVAVPFTTDWWLNEHPVPDGPAASLAGPYIRLVVGLGWSR